MGRKRNEVDTARIYTPRLNQWKRSLQIRHNLFCSPVIFELFDDRIEFTLAIIDNMEESISFSHSHSGWYVCTIRADNCPVGTFLIDEDESTVDKVIIYFEDKL